eukprot:6755491-Alexandrium_andersonii.AAC.1
MSASLVGSEMCIRDRAHPCKEQEGGSRGVCNCPGGPQRTSQNRTKHGLCLLYTSDAADDM